MKVNIKAYVHAQKRDRWDSEKQEWVPEVSYVIHACDMTKYIEDSVFIGEQEIEVEIPDDFDFRPGLVESLEREKKAVMAEFGKRVAELDAKIQKLLAIEG